MSELLERDAELQLLEDLAQRSRSRGQIALVTGEAGIGKSSLIEAFAQRRASKHLVVRGQCDDLVAPRRWGPFLDLAAALGTSVSALLSSGASREDLFPALLTDLGALPPGTAYILEDVHWADHASLDFLMFMTRRMAPLRLLLVLSYRDDEVGLGHPLTSLLGNLPSAITTRVRLDPLSRSAVEALARRTGRDGDQLYQATAGQPFYLSEVLAQPQRAGELVPASIRDAVLSRLARLEPHERRFMEAVSVAPDPLSAPAIEGLLGSDGYAAGLACEARGLVLRDRDGRFRFRHELARVATLGALAPSAVQADHRRLLDTYLAMGAHVPPDVLVHHASALADAPVVLAHAPRAALSASTLGAHRDAARYLSIALLHAHVAPPELAARLYQDWSYEAGLYEVTDAVIAARREAVRRWRLLERLDRVGDNLRWLWRLHWYRGETDLAETFAKEAMAVLESIPASAELARAYSLRSHLHMLSGQRAACVASGRQALDLAARFGDAETLVRTQITVATAMLFDGNDEGRQLMEEGMSGAAAAGQHEETARAYTNYAEFAIVRREWRLAERLLTEGLAFGTKHSLDSWTGYLTGRHAQWHLDQGRLAEAMIVAQGALAVEGRTVLMRLPAMTTLAIARSRIAAEDAPALLEEVLRSAVAMREQQRITPARLALIEHHFLRDRMDDARTQVRDMLSFGTAALRPWDVAALCVWARRLCVSVPEAFGSGATPAQALELQGDPIGAAVLLDQGCVAFESALCRYVAARAGRLEQIEVALAAFDHIGCVAGVQAVRRLAASHGASTPALKRRRGPYRAARNHPLGLTAKEVQVLAMLVEGASNAELAERQSRSLRTVEHHVSAVLAKLGVSNRLEAVLRVMAEPWIIQF